MSYLLPAKNITLEGEILGGHSETVLEQCCFF